MSDKNRVITNGLFRKKMAELLGEDIVNTPQFNDFQALDVSTFTKEVDKLIDNPPWSGGGSGGDSDFEYLFFSIDDQMAVTCSKTPYQVEAIEKPILAFASMNESSPVILQREAVTTFNAEMVDLNGKVTISASGNTWVCNYTFITPTYKARAITSDGQTYTITVEDEMGNAATLAHTLSLLGMREVDGKYEFPANNNIIKDIAVDLSINGTGDVSEAINSIGKLHFSVADGISKTVNFSGSVISLVSDGDGGFVDAPVIFNLRVGEEEDPQDPGTFIPVYTLTMKNVT